MKLAAHLRVLAWLLASQKGFRSGKKICAKEIGIDRAASDFLGVLRVGFLAIFALKLLSAMIAKRGAKIAKHFSSKPAALTRLIGLRAGRRRY